MLQNISWIYFDFTLGSKSEVMNDSHQVALLKNNNKMFHRKLSSMVMDGF